MSLQTAKHPSSTGPAKASSTASESVRVLIADDEPVTRKLMSRYLTDGEYLPVVASDGVEAMEEMTDDVSVALVDLNMPNASGMDVLAFIREEFPDTQVIIVSGEGEIRDAVLAMKAGACDYIVKPINREELLATLEQAVERARLSRENRGLRAAVGSPMPKTGVASKSPSAKQLLKHIKKVAPLDSSVLLAGESGTGKTTLARLIHQKGNRSGGPFIAVNCASLPRDLIEAELFGHCKGAFTGATSDRPGRIEIADGGTLFLDEIGDLPLELQPKLLTFLQDRTVQRIGSNTSRTVDVRIVAATHQDLEGMCTDGQFRQDLFYRLNVLNLFAPPLRERTADIIPIANDVLARIANRRGAATLQLSDQAEGKLRAYAWPGNIRELENVLERASAFCEDATIELEDVEPHLGKQPTIDEESATTAATVVGKTLADIERMAILQTLDACDGNKAKSARMLGISEKSIYNKMRRLEIDWQKS